MPHGHSLESCQHIHIHVFKIIHVSCEMKSKYGRESFGYWAVIIKKIKFQ